MKRIISVIALAVLALLPPAGAIGSPVPDFPLPRKHSEVAALATNLEVRPGPICNPIKEEFVARFDAAGYHWMMAASVSDDGSSIFLLVRYQPGADLPEYIYRGHSPADSNDTIVIDSVITFEQAQKLGGPCDLLYAPQA